MRGDTSFADRLISANDNSLALKEDLVQLENDSLFNFVQNYVQSQLRFRRT